MKTDGSDELEDHWEHNSIKTMLNLYLLNIDKFRNPKVKKKNVWVDISNAVGKGPDSCDKKFRNLKQTYVRLLKKRNSNELFAIKWPYFKIFDQIYNENAQVEYLETEEAFMNLNQNESIETDQDQEDDSEDHWEHNSIKQMLNLYLQNVEKFRSPKVRKRNLWIDIANAVSKGPDCCDKKFRNLKQTYLRLLKKRNRNELVDIKWPYFKTFEQIYNENGDYNPDIQHKLQDGTADAVTNVLLSMAENSNYKQDFAENGESSSCLREPKRKLTKKRFTDLRKITLEMKNRQKTVEEKLDRLINIVQESNNIQRERNRLFQQFLDSLNQNT